MRRAWLGLGLGLGLACFGCGHTKTTAAENVSEPPPGASPPTDRPPASAGKGEGHAHHAGPTETSGIPVASSPEALLAPGGERDIRDKLVDEGYLKKGDESQSTEAALRQFQKTHDLPETGVADHQTVKALGLDPNRIFKHADVNE